MLSSWSYKNTSSTVVNSTWMDSLHMPALDTSRRTLKHEHPKLKCDLQGKTNKNTKQINKQTTTAKQELFDMI